MVYGFEVFDSEGELTASDVQTFRVVDTFNVSTSTSFTHTTSLASVTYSGAVFILFMPAEAGSGPAAGQNFYAFDDGVPTISVSGSTVTTQGEGIAGTAYVGVT